MRVALTAAAFVCLFATPVFSQPPSSEPAAAPGGPTVGPKADPDSASAAETAQPQKRSIPFRGGVLAYTVTPGTLTIRDDDGVPRASVFYTAYTLDRPKGAAARPLTFLFNGGPGSSSMWLAMGSFGPLKLEASGLEVLPPAPYRFSPNPDTLLDKSDLVFIDAVSTGLSRPVGKGTGKEFYSVDGDLDAFTRIIQRYLTIYGGWDAPKFLIGESYGTLRAAGLAYALQQHGIQLNGVVLLSSVLDFALVTGAHDQTYVALIPSYAAAALFHKKVVAKTSGTTAFLDEVRAFAQGPYSLALAQGDALPAAEREAMARRLAAYTGLSETFILRDNLRVPAEHFRKELLRDQRRTLGRLDGRFEGADANASGEAPDYDASEAAVSGAFIGAINDYLFRDLNFHSGLAYRPNYYGGIGYSWDWRHRSPDPRQQLTANTAVDLGDAMRQNPRLKVLSVNGLYDLGTPFSGAEYDLRHMQIEPALQANLTFRYYPSGHMVYVDAVAAHQLKADLDAFYDSATVRG